MAVDIDRTLAGLATPIRRRIVGHLRRGPRRAGGLARACGMSSRAMSRHLRVLRRCGLIEGGGLDEDARVRLYRLRPEPFSHLQSWLGQVPPLLGGDGRGV